METILYSRNIIIETIDYGDLIQRPHVIYICIGFAIFMATHILWRFSRKTNKIEHLLH